MGREAAGLEPQHGAAMHGAGQGGPPEAIEARAAEENARLPWAATAYEYAMRQAGIGS